VFLAMNRSSLLKCAEEGLVSMSHEIILMHPMRWDEVFGE
jgi:hypothetical protein